MLLVSLENPGIDMFLRITAVCEVRSREAYAEAWTECKQSNNINKNKKSYVLVLETLICMKGNALRLLIRAVAMQ